jgi:hypothetical protein
MTWHCARQNEIRLTGNETSFDGPFVHLSMGERALLMLDDPAATRWGYGRAD